MSKKLLIWGTGLTYGFFKNIIFSLEENGHFEIVGLVNNKAEKNKDGYTVYSAMDVPSLDYDRIVICAEGIQAASIKEDIKSLGINEERTIPCDRFLDEMGLISGLHDKAVNTQLKVIEDILNASEDEINSVEWMKDKIAEYGVYPFGEAKEDGKTNWNQWGVLQVIDEFAEYCVFLSQLNVKNAIEIGVFKGRSSYLMCAILSRKNKNLSYRCVDIYDNLDCFEKYKKLLPALDKAIPTTSGDYQEQEYDYVFIDADHSYDGSINDYRNVGCYGRVVTVFHDIYGKEYEKLNGGVPRTWREVCEETKEHDHLIFSKYPEKWMGIGVIKWNRCK